MVVCGRRRLSLFETLNLGKECEGDNHGTQTQGRHSSVDRTRRTLINTSGRSRGGSISAVMAGSSRDDSDSGSRRNE